MPTVNDDDGILAHYRVRYPYISLKQAKELHRIEAKFAHLGRAKQQRERLATELVRREVRKKLFGVSDGEESDLPQ